MEKKIEVPAEDVSSGSQLAPSVGYSSNTERIEKFSANVASGDRDRQDEEEMEKKVGAGLSMVDPRNRAGGGGPGQSAPVIDLTENETAEPVDYDKLPQDHI